MTEERHRIEMNYTHIDGHRVSYSFPGDAAWPDCIEHCVSFLRALGYVIPEGEWVPTED